MVHDATQSLYIVNGSQIGDMRYSGNAKSYNYGKCGRLYLQADIEECQATCSGHMKHQSIAQQHKGVDDNVKHIKAKAMFEVVPKYGYGTVDRF